MLGGFDFLLTPRQSDCVPPVLNLASGPVVAEAALNVT